MEYELSHEAWKAARQASLNNSSWAEVILAAIRTELASGNLANPADAGQGAFRVLQAFGGYAVLRERILPNGGTESNFYFMPANPEDQAEAVAVCAVLNALYRKASKTTE